MNVDDVVQGARHDRKARPNHPTGWEPGAELGESGGVFVPQPRPFTEGELISPEREPWDDHLRRAGLDPQLVEVQEPVEIRTWDAAIGNGEVQTMVYFRARIVTRDRKQADAELRAWVRKWKPLKSAPQPEGNHTLVVCWADPQIGKDDGDGTAGTVERWMNSHGQVQDRIRELKRQGVEVERIVVASLGDIVEGCTGHYCVTTDTPVLTHELRWVPAGNLTVGDKLYAIQEHGDPRSPGASKPGVKHRRYAPSVVEAHEVVDAPVVTVRLENGDSITCTPEHPLLARRRSSPRSVRRYEWVPAAELTPDHELPKLMETWEPDQSWEAGWLAGMFDGEGYLSGNAGRHSAKSNAGVAQLPGPVLDLLRRALTDRKFDYLDRVNKKRGVYGLRIRGGYHEVLRLLGSIRPLRLIAKLDYPQANPKQTVRVVSVEDAGTQPIAMMSTTSRTYITAGYPSHNSQQTYRVELNNREQRRTARQVIVAGLKTFSDIAPVTVLPVGGNHGEVRNEGASFTDFADNIDVAVIEDAADILQENERFAHVTFHIPHADLTQTIDLHGTIVGLAHGHQAKRGGSSPAQKLENWWQGQMKGRQPIGDADVLLSGHFHTFLAQSIGPRMHFQAPTIDGGSEWWRDTAGTESPAGVLTLVIGEDGWDHMRVLPAVRR